MKKFIMPTKCMGGCGCKKKKPGAYVISGQGRSQMGFFGGLIGLSLENGSIFCFFLLSPTMPSPKCYLMSGGLLKNIFFSRKIQYGSM